MYKYRYTNMDGGENQCGKMLTIRESKWGICDDTGNLSK